jgi:hypothetical protein
MEAGLKGKLANSLASTVMILLYGPIRSSEIGCRGVSMSLYTFAYFSKISARNANGPTFGSTVPGICNVQLV